MILEQSLLPTPRQPHLPTPRFISSRPRLHDLEPNDPLRVLLVEDNPADARLIRELLGESRSTRYVVTHVPRLDEAVRALAEKRFDAILLDLGLPDARGLEALVPVNTLAPDLPIVVLTGNDDQEIALRAVQAGAQDYLVKGDADAKLLVRAIRYALERKQHERHIRHLADHDSLTQLPHGRLLRDRLRQALALSRRHKKMAALLFVDLDLFKQVNDTLGHAAGDAVLVQAARRLERCVRETDTVARVGGDEFALVVADITDVKQVARMADKALAALEAPMRARGRRVRIDASIGISVFPQDGTDPDTLLRRADLAMYRAKREGRGRHRFYAASDGLHVPRHLALMGGLPHAIERGELLLHFQPLIDLKRGSVSAIEALLRWRHPRLGIVPPNEIVSLAEETRLIATLEAWVLQHAGEQGRKWATTFFPPWRMAVNLSRRELETGNLAAMVTTMLAETGLDPWLLELDLNAGVLADCGEPVLSAVRDVRATGVRIHLDDFGVEPLSLSRMKSLPIDGVKIDRLLVAGCVRDDRDGAIVRAAIELAHGLRLQVTAEGVESAAQLDFVRNLGCDRAQGGYFSMPVPPESLSERLGRTWH
jgi:diguanylate cyclase (GGDEF)-like protein